MAKPQAHLQEGDGVLVVDVQRDFCPGGALPIPEGDAVVPVINRWISAALEKEVPVYYSLDWHPQGHPSFQVNGGEWPVHCLQNSPGAATHPDLVLPPSPVLIIKGARFDQDQLSAFHETGFADQLHRDGVTRLWVAGLALDVCVAATALDGIKAGFEIGLPVDACRPVTEEGGQKALEVLRKAGVLLLEE